MAAETVREVFLDMRERITKLQSMDGMARISSLTTAYDTAYKSVDTLLKQVQQAIIARQQAEEAMMVATLSILTGGVLGVVGEGLIKKFPVVTKIVRNSYGLKSSAGLPQVMRVAVEDHAVYKLFKGMTKDVVVKSGTALADLGFDQFKGTPPSSGFSPVGMSVEEYRNALLQGAINRAKALWAVVDLMYQFADDIELDTANQFRKNLYADPFFNMDESDTVDSRKLVRKAQLALWCAWGMVRDRKYWEIQKAFVPYSRGSESMDFGPVRDLLADLGVPEANITLVGLGQSSFFHGGKVVKGLDVNGFTDWVMGGGMNRVLLAGINISPEFFKQSFKVMMMLRFGVTVNLPG